jgi:predicted RNase H-like HicB family nuclease
MAKHTYIAALEASDDGFGVFFPDLPGCTSFGVDLDDAIAQAEEALGLHLEGMAEDEQAFPEARKLAAIKEADGEGEGLVWVAISADIPDGTERFNVYFPKALLHQIEKFGERSGIDNRSTFLRLASRFYMAHHPVGKAEVVRADAGQVKLISERAIEASARAQGGSQRRIKARLTPSG